MTCMTPCVADTRTTLHALVTEATVRTYDLWECQSCGRRSTSEELQEIARRVGMEPAAAVMQGNRLG